MTTLVALLTMTSIMAQGHEKGTVHIDLGVNGAIQDTEFEQTYDVDGTQFHIQDSDGSLAVTVPIALRLGIYRPLSLGLYVEPGSYIDSSAQRSHALMLIGVQPRLYMVNKKNFALFADGQIGGTFIRLRDVEGAITEDAKYNGPHYGAGAGIGVYFGNVVGMNFRLGYITTDSQLRQHSQEGSAVQLENVEADLRTTGVELSAGFTFRL